MSAEHVDRVLDAAYRCVLRFGVRKTTMDDIAAAAGMSRPAVYQYVRNKEDALRRVAGRIFDQALGEAREAAIADGTLAQRLDRILAVKLGLTQRMLRDSPFARELLGDSRIDLDRAFAADLTDLLTVTIAEAAAGADLSLADDKAREIAELALALTRGLEADLSDPLRTDPLRTDPLRADPLRADPLRADLDRPRERLRNGVALLVAGLAAATRAR